MFQLLSAVAETVTVEPETSPDVGEAVIVAGTLADAVSASASGASVPRVAAVSSTPVDTATRRERKERIIRV